MRQVQSVSFVTDVRNKYLGSFGKRGRFSVRNSILQSISPDQLEEIQPEQT